MEDGNELIDGQDHELLHNNLSGLNTLLQQQGEIETTEVNFNLSPNSYSNQNSENGINLSLGASNEKRGVVNRNLVYQPNRQIRGNSTFSQCRKTLQPKTNNSDDKYSPVRKELKNIDHENKRPQNQPVLTDKNTNFDSLALRLKQAYDQRQMGLEDEKNGLEEEQDTVTKNWSKQKTETKKLEDKYNTQLQENERLVDKLNVINSEVSRQTNERINLEGNLDLLSREKHDLSDEKAKRLEQDKQRIASKREADGLQKDIISIKDALESYEMSNKFLEEENNNLKERLSISDSKFEELAKGNSSNINIMKQLDESLKQKSKEFEAQQNANKVFVDVKKNNEELKIGYEGLELENKQIKVRNEELANSQNMMNSECVI